MFEYKDRGDWKVYPDKEAAEKRFGPIPANEDGEAAVQVASLAGGGGMSLAEAHSRIGSPEYFTIVGGNGWLNCRVA